jgi:sugar transferase EpsL
MSQGRLQAAAKRTTDLLLAVCGLPVALPLAGAVASAIWLTMGRPILFLQTRQGLSGRPFTLVKFRTMRVAPPDASPPDEIRITRLGAFLRRTSLDELPEMWNVLKGDMSLVGPRPLLQGYLERYTSRQARRLEMKPGITGLAQVSGRNALSWEEKFDLDVWYVDHWSVWLDLKVLARTGWDVITGRGVSAPGHATMPEFQGEGQ